MNSKLKVGIQFIVAVMAIAFVVGCASVPLHTETSTSDIHAAETLGAADVPQAALHLQLAKEELKLAEDLAKEGEDERAASMLLRAEADAELAIALTNEHTARVEAENAIEQVYQLRRDNP